MNILWVKIGGLWPLDMGGRLRSFHTVAELAKRHRVTVLTTHGPGEDPGALARALSQCERVVSFPYASPKAGTASFARALMRSWFSPLPVDLYKCRVDTLRKEVDRLLDSGTIDLVVADFLFAAPNVKFDRTPVILFEHNVESMIWKRLAGVEQSPWKRALLQIEWRKVARAERRACEEARMVVAVSEIDGAVLAANAPAARVRSIATGVDTAFFTRNGIPERPAHLVFTGAMDWYPNEDAMLFFLSDILPAIRREVRDVTFTIAGRKPSDRLKAIASAAGAHVTGTVDDVRPFIDEAAVYVVPMRIGGGTRLKIFEALSMRKAVVSTTIGAEGLPLTDDEHFVRADQPSHFASSIVSLLRDEKRRALLGQRGMHLVRSRYSWQSVAEQFEAACMEALGA